MFGLFKKKEKQKTLPQLLDLGGIPIQPGDKVEAHRYDLGECLVILEEDVFYYQSIKSNEKVSYVRMIDAITGNQKVNNLT